MQLLSADLFLGSAGALPSKTIRHSLLASVSARKEPRPPKFIPSHTPFCPMSLVPCPTLKSWK
jgi:hypothetical protein